MNAKISGARKNKNVRGLRISINTRIVLVLSLVIATTIMTIGFTSYIFARNSLNDRILHGLEAVASARESHLRAIVEQDHERVALIASRTKLRECLAAIGQKDALTPELQGQMNKILQDAKKSVPEIVEISVMDLNGDVQASTDQSMINQNFAGSVLFKTGLIKSHIDQLEQPKDKLLYRISAPMLSPDGAHKIGVIVVRIELGRVIDMLNDYSGLGQTGETVLGSRHGDLVDIVGALRDSSSNPAYRFNINQDAPKPLSLAARGKEGLIVDKDYRGHPVLAAYRNVEPVGWALVVKINEDEAFAPIRELRSYLILVGFLLILFSPFLAFAASRSVTRRIRNLQAGARRVASGELGLQIDCAGGNDELAELSSAFNDMSSRLLKDINQRKAAASALLEARVQLAQSEKMAAIGTLASGIAHELNNPLMGIGGYLYQIKDKTFGTDSADLAELALAEAQRCSRIIRDLLLFCRPSASEMEEFDCSELLKSVQARYDSVLSDHGIEYAFKLSEGNPCIYGNPTYFELVLCNLLDNAIDAVREASIKTIKVELKETIEDVILQICDSGSGISEENLSRVCEPFFTTKGPFEGTGLGLAICSGIVKGFGGTLSFESKAGSGTTVTISLPQDHWARENKQKRKVANRNVG